MAGNVRVVLKSVFDDKGIRQAQGEFAKIGRTAGIAFSAIGAAAGVAGAALVSFGSKSLTAASDLEESLNAINVSYGRASRSITALGEDAASRLGVTQTAFNQAAVRFSSFAEQVVGAGGDVTGFVDDITLRASDFASVFNIDVAEALRVFQSGLSGEAEPLKRFGINLLDSEVKAFALRTEMIKQGETLTQVQKVQARYGLLMESTAKTAGDFANTSDGLANSQRILEASMNDVFASVGKSLLPAFAEINKVLIDVIPQFKEGLVPASQALADVFSAKVMPAIRSFGAWIASPEGTEGIKKFATTVVDGVTGFVDLAREVINNWDALTKFATFAIGAAIAITTLNTALQLATAAQLLFNFAVSKNPYVIAATAIITLAGGIALFTANVKESRDETDISLWSTEELADQMRRLTQDYEAGIVPLEFYTKRMQQLRDQLAATEKNFGATTGEAGRFNKIKMDNAITEIGRIERAVGSLRGQLSASAGEANRFRNILAGIPETKITTGGGGGGGTKTDPAAEARKRFLAVQKVLQEHQKKLAAAEKSYAAEIYDLNQESEKNLKKLREKAASDQLALVNQSKKRLTDSFATATRTALSSLFDSKTVTELTQSVRRVSAALTITTTQETERIISGSVGDVIEGLRKKILGARTLIENASKLAGLGFSQTFIEQVIEGGTETGNELAKAILEASPETQAELKRLFLDLEDVTENGMGALATKIYNEQGLATQELKKLYTDVATELNDALIAEQARLASALVGAGLAFNLAVLEIKDEFLSALEEFDGAFAGLGSTIEAFLKKLDVTAAGAVTDVKAALTGPGGALAGASVTQDVAFKDLAPLKAVSGLVVDSMQDVAGTIAYLQERINAANRFARNIDDPRQAASALASSARFSEELAALRGAAAAGTAAGTTININVKTDTTQSQAMVGRTIGNIVTKYVTTGGQVLVSGNA